MMLFHLPRKYIIQLLLFQFVHISHSFLVVTKSFIISRNDLLLKRKHLTIDTTTSSNIQAYTRKGDGSREFVIKPSSSKLTSSKKNTPQKGVGYRQTGSPIDPSICNLTKEQIVEALKNRSKARRRRDFQAADEILFQLKLSNVSVDDNKKLWRADGISFVLNDPKSVVDNDKNINIDQIMNQYTKSNKSKYISPEDEQFVKVKLRLRIEARVNYDYDTADEIRDELLYLYNIQIDDTKKVWVVGEPFKPEYTFGGRRVLNLSPEKLKTIEDLIKDRAKAKKDRDFETADSILETLSTIHNVRVDDTKKEWHFLQLPKTDDYFNSRDDDDRVDRYDDSDRNVSKNRKDSVENKSSKNKKKSEWSVVQSNDIPQGISLVEDTFTNYSNQLPEGVIIESEDTTSNLIPVSDAIEMQNNYPDSTRENGISSPSQQQVLESMTVPMLKEKLREKGLALSGKKIDLIQRLLTTS